MNFNKKTKNNSLITLANILNKKFSLTILLGVEIEFYAHGNIDLLDIQQKFDLIINKERGNNQFEINLPPCQDVERYALYIKHIRNNLQEYAKKHGGEIDFRGKPYKNDFGNSMHVHINFLEEENYDKYAIILCNHMQEYLSYFFPEKEDYRRLDHRFMAPTHISYGGNNRTTAIRIPNSIPRRMEHRLACANADPYLVFYAILESIVRGLEDPSHIIEFEKIYGNAFDPQYKLKPILDERIKKQIESFSSQK